MNFRAYFNIFVQLFSTVGLLNFENVPLALEKDIHYQHFSLFCLFRPKVCTYAVHQHKRPWFSHPMFVFGSTSALFLCASTPKPAANMILMHFMFNFNLNVDLNWHWVVSILSGDGSGRLCQFVRRKSKSLKVGSDRNGIDQTSIAVLDFLLCKWYGPKLLRFVEFWRNSSLGQFLKGRIRALLVVFAWPQVKIPSHFRLHKFCCWKKFS